MWCLPPQQPGQCPAAGDPFPPGVTASRGVPLPGEGARGVLACTPQGEGAPHAPARRPRALWQLPGLGSSDCRAGLGGSLPLGSPLGRGGSSCVTGFEPSLAAGGTEKPEEC